MNDMQIFNVGDHPWRFGVTDNGTPYAVAADVAKSFDYRDAANALRVLDEDEKGTQILSTPGGDQRVSVIYEDGLWELIFRSTKPEAKAIKKRVKAILRELRETGRYEVEPKQEITRKELAKYWYDAEARAEAAEHRAEELEPAATAWAVLADAKGDYSLREAAQILDRDPHITTGQNRLSKYLKTIRWTDSSGQPYQAHVNAGRLVRRSITWEHPKTFQEQADSQIRITARGVKDLRDRMTGSSQLAIDGGE